MVYVPLQSYREYPPEEMAERARRFLEEIRGRRTVRHFSDRPVDPGVIEDCVRAAATAPSGANRQPWHFVVVSDPAVKHEIREAAEVEEREFYERRAPDEWLEALEPFETNADKPFLETAPYLIVIFAQLSGRDSDGSRIKHYYVKESVGIATGFLIAALHHAGLATLTHTPSPMRFLNEILDRPENETPFLVLVVGYPEAGAKVPDIDKKPFAEVVSGFAGDASPPGTESPASSLPERGGDRGAAAPAVDEEGYRVKGSSIRSKLDFVRDRFGAERERELLEAFAQHRLGRILDSSWYPYTLYIDVLAAIVDRCFAGDVERLQEVGADSAKRALDTTYRAFRSGTYSGFLAKQSRLHHMLYSEGESSVTLGGEGGSCKVVLRGKPRLDAEDLNVALGFYLECGRLFGHADIRGSFSRAADRATFDLRWDQEG